MYLESEPRVTSLGGLGNTQRDRTGSCQQETSVPHPDASARPSRSHSVPVWHMEVASLPLNRELDARLNDKPFSWRKGWHAVSQLGFDHILLCPAVVSEGPLVGGPALDRNRTKAHPQAAPYCCVWEDVAPPSSLLHHCHYYPRKGTAQVF